MANLTEEYTEIERSKTSDNTRKEKEMDFTVSFVPVARGIIIALSVSQRPRLPSAHAPLMPPLHRVRQMPGDSCLAFLKELTTVAHLSIPI